MKKWTFLVATLLTISAGSLATSCIDNDEPAGIEQIRVATANLLEAKKAVLLAQAEATKVDAENRKLLAAADAKIKEAEAKVKEAEAQIAAAEAAGKQAEADKIKAETEAIVAKAKAELEAMISQNELNLKNAQLAYDKAVYEFEQLKKTNADKLDNQLFQAVTSAYQAYLAQLQSYNAANAAYLQAQRELAESELDLEWNGSSFESPEWDKKAVLTKAVADAQADVDNINNSVATLDEAIAKLKGIQGTELYTLLTEYQAKVKENTAAQEDVKVELSQLHYKNEALYGSVPDLEGKIADLMGEKIAIEAYTYPGNTAIPGFEGEQKIVEKGEFSLDELDAYDEAVDAYKYNIEAMTNAILSPNQVAWTTAEIAELQRSQEAATKAYNDANKKWGYAQSIYATGEKPNIADAPNAAAIEKAIAALNTVGAKLNTAKDAVVAAHTAAAAAQKAYDAASKLYFEGDASKKVAATNAKTTYDNAIAAAEKAYKDAEKENNKTAVAAQDAVDALRASQALAEQAAQNRTNAAERQYNLATATAQANPTAANVAAQTNALKAWNDAITAQNKLVTDNATAMQKAQETAQKAWENANLLNLAADNVRLNAIDAANLAFMTAGGNIVDGSYNQAADPAYKPVQEALAAKTAADKKLGEETKAFNKFTGDATKTEIKAVTEGFNKQQKELGSSFELTKWNDFTAKFVTYSTVPAATADDKTWKKFAGDKLKDESYENLSPFMVLNSSTGVYTNAKAYVEQTSKVLYGENVDASRLKPLTVAEMNAIIAADPQYKDTPSYMYYKLYGALFGAYGKVEGDKVQLEIAKATLNNANIVKEAVAELEAKLKALEESKANQEAAVKAVKADLKTVKDKIAALEGDLNTKLAALEHEASDLNGIVGTISSAILTLNNIQGAGEADQVIEDAIENLEDQIEAKQTPLKNAEDRLAKAKFQLTQFENGYADLENPLKLAVEAAKAELDLQQAQLDFCKARLDEAQAKYEANAKA